MWARRTQHPKLPISPRKCIKKLENGPFGHSPVFHVTRKSNEPNLPNRIRKTTEAPQHKNARRKNLSLQEKRVLEGYQKRLHDTTYAPYFGASPYIKVRINNITVAIVLDTGCPNSLMSAALAKTLFKDYEHLLQPTKQTMVSASGHDLTQKGRLSVRIFFTETFSIEHKVFVIEDDSAIFSFLLGNSFLVDRCDILKSRALTIEDNGKEVTVPILYFSEPFYVKFDEPFIMDIDQTATKTAYVCNKEGKKVNFLAGQTVMLTQATKDSSEYYEVVPSIITVTNESTVQVLLANHSVAPLPFDNNEIVARCRPVRLKTPLHYVIIENDCTPGEEEEIGEVCQYIMHDSHDFREQMTDGLKTSRLPDPPSLGREYEEHVESKKIWEVDFSTVKTPTLSRQQRKALEEVIERNKKVGLQVPLT